MEVRRSIWSGMERASVATGGYKRVDVMDRHKKKKSEWLVILLIILFFAIPVYGLAVINDSANVWPRHSTSFVYNLFLK